MMVARQFIAWYPCKNGNRPVGHGMIGSDRRADDQDDESTVGKDQTVPYGTDSRLNLFQAINCLATIIQSLRDALATYPAAVGRRRSTVRSQPLQIRHLQYPFSRLGAI
jgi:hypothetical protein